MRVPTKVSTSTPYPVQLGAPAAAPAVVQGAGFFAEIDDLSKQLHENYQKKQAFDLNAAYTHEVGAMDQDFQERKDTVQPGQGSGFALQTATDYTARHQALIQGLAATKKYTPKQLAQLSTQLEEKRNSFIVPALQWEKAVTGVDTLTGLKNQMDDLGRQAAMNPNNVEGILHGVDEAYRLAPGLTALERVQGAERDKDAISLAAGAGYATLNPADTIKLLTGTDPRHPTAATSSGGASVTAQVLTPLFVAQESGGKYTAVNPDTGAMGKYQVMPATGEALAKKAGVTWIPELMTKDSPEAKAYQDKIGAAAIADSIAAGGGDPAATFSHYYSGSTTAYKDAKGNPKTAKYVQDMMGRLEAVPAAANDAAAVTPQETTSLPANGKTGIPALDNIDAEQRFHILAMAREEFRRRDTQDKTDVEVKHQNSLAQADAGVAVTNPPSHEDYIRAWGPNIGPQKEEELNAQKRLGTFKKGMNTLTDAQIAAQVAALKPSNPETFAVDSKAYAEAQQAASQIISARQTDAAGYVIGQYPGVKEAWAGAHDANGRQAAYTAMNTAYNNLGTPAVDRKPMTKEQASNMKVQFETMPDTQKLATIRSWQNEMGPLFPQGMRQLSDSGLGVETYLADMMKTTPSYGGTAVRVLQGLRIMKENPALMPDERAFNSVFTSSINPQTQVKIAPADMDAVKKAAMALYVADGGAPGHQTNQNTLAPYLRQALGGDKNNSDTGWMNGGLGFQTILPAGVTGSLFSHWKDGLTGNDLLHLGGGDYPRYGSGTYAPAAAIVNNGVFVKRAPDRYEIHMMPDGGTLRNKDGSPYIMVVTPDQVRKHF